MIRKSVPYVPQMEVAECGVACLTMLLSYYGRHYPLFELRARSGVGRNGLSAARLLELARAEGLLAKGGRVEVEGLKRNELYPNILHWKMDHFVIGERATSQGLRIVDPAAGRRTVPWGEVSRDFSGVCLLFEPGPGFEKLPRRRPGVHVWRGTLTTLLPTIATVVLLGFAFDLLSFAFPAVMSAFVDYVIPAQSRSLFIALGVAVLSIALVRAIFVSARLRVMEGVRADLELRLGRDLVSRLLKLEVPFFVKRSTGDLATRINAVLSLRETLLAATQAAFDLLLLIAYFALLFAYNVKLSAILATLVFIRVALAVQATRRLGDYAVSEAVARSDVGEVFVEAFGNVEAVKALSLERYFVDKLDRARSRELGAISAAGETASRYSAVLTVFEQLTLAAILLVGGKSVIDGSMALGAFTSFLAVESLVAGRTVSMTTLATALARVGPTIDRLDDILCAPTEPTGGASPITGGAIEVRNVTFSFDELDEPTVAAVSFRVAKGEHVALVGRSGSGKSTILRILAGLLKPQEGMVLIGERALDDIDAGMLRRRLGFVPAATHTFDGTIATNVSLLSQADNDEVTRSLLALDLGPVLEKRKLGIHTDLPRERPGLSAGQCQRLLLSRAFVKKPDFLILDEATSALDEATEQIVIRQLKQHGRTIVSATHRPAIMRAANRIIVIEDGRIADEGTFDDLMSRSPAFREVVA